MTETRVAHVTEMPYPQKGWDASAWDGNKAFVTPAAWHRYWEFRGRSMTVIIMSDEWSLDYQTAKEIAIEIAKGKRSYYSLPLNEDKPTWRKIW